MTSKWQRFSARYLIIGAVGTLVVYFGSQLLTIPSPTPPSPTRSRRPQPRPTVTVVEPPPAPHITSQDHSQDDYVAPPLGEAVPDEDETLETPPLGQPVGGPDPEPEPEPEPGPEPEPQPPPPKHMQWGAVTKNNAGAYNRSGSFLRRVPAGTLVEFSETRSSPSAGSMALCTVLSNGKKYKDILMRMEDLDTTLGSLADAADEHKKIRVSRAKLLAQIKTRIQELNTLVNKKNPHAANYAQTKKAYLAFWEEVKSLQKKRDGSSGEKFMEYSDELRRMKGQDIDLSSKLKETKAKYVQWKNSQGQNLPADATLNNLQARLRGMDKQIIPHESKK